MLENQQGQHTALRSVWHILDAWERPDVCAPEDGVQKSQENDTAFSLELYGVVFEQSMGRLSMASRTSRRADTEEQTERKHTQEKDAQGSEEEEGRLGWCATHRTSMAFSIPWRHSAQHTGRRKSRCLRESGFIGHSFEGSQHASSGSSPAHCCREFCTSPNHQGTQECGGQDGQGQTETTRSTGSTGQPTYQLEGLHRRLCQKMDAVCRAIWQRRCRPRREGESCARQTPEDQGGCGEQEAGVGNYGRRVSDRGLRRRNAGSHRHVREYPRKPSVDGLQLAKHAAESRGSIRRGQREQEQKAETGRATIRSWCSCAAVWWSGFYSHGAFWKAGQVDQWETCPGQNWGSEAVLLNWSHSFTFDPEYQSVWAASIAGLDLSWEVGTLSSTLSSSSQSSLSLRPKRSKIPGRRVHFQKPEEHYVGDLSSSTTFLKQSVDIFEYPFSLDFAQIAYYTDESSLMALGTLTSPRELAMNQNREAAAVFDDPMAARQDEEPAIQADPDQDLPESESSSSSESDSGEFRRPAIVYSLDWDPMHCRPRWSTYEKLHKDIAVHFDISIHDLTVVHAVRSPPVDLLAAKIQPFIAQKPGDVTEGSNFQLTLIDVEFHNALPSLEQETVRRVRLMPMTLSRKALLALLGLEAHCRYVKKACLVWHNGDPVKTQARSLMNLRHGDFLRVAVPPGRGELRRHYTREVAQCLRRGYLPSNVPAVLEAHPEGLNVVDMPVVDNFNYIPRAADLDYDRDAMALLQLQGWSLPAYEAWPDFLQRPSGKTPRECKVGEDDVRDPVIPSSDIQPAVEGGHPELDFGEVTQFLQGLHPLWQHYAAVEREDEGRVLYVRTWYTDHLRHPRCEHDRAVRLLQDPWSWPDALAERWDDLIDPDERIDLYLVRPSPRSRGWEEADAVPHIVLVQRPQAELRSLHITTIDPANQASLLTSFVLASPRRIRKRYFLELLGILDDTVVESLVDCMVWHGDLLLEHHEVFQSQHGDSFLIILNHLRDIVRRAASAASSSDGLNLLQRNVKRQHLHLNDLVLETSETSLPRMQALRVIWRLPPGPHPSFIEVPIHATEPQLEAEFQGWGISCRPVACFERDAVICLPLAAEHPAQEYDYIFVNMDLEDDEFTFLHTQSHALDDHGLMKHLYALGFWRAVIHSEQEIYPKIYKVTFINQRVQMASHVDKGKTLPEWPPPQCGPRGTNPFYHGHADFGSDTLIDIGLTHADIAELFDSHKHVLQTSFGPSQPPEEIVKAIAACDQSIANSDLDRLLVYADGSSLGALKHVPPLRAEEEGSGDTWAYVVVGERYHPPGLKFMGWNAQAVHYEPSSNVHIGASRLGADVAEKEGLAWGALWRLSQNWNIATCFRSDSRTALGQAEGVVGAAQLDDTLAFLRGVCQAVETAIEPENVIYAHVPGHAGEVWNELCDWLAKEERRRSFYCPRPHLAVQRWRKSIGHAWMLFNNHPDLPAFCGEGFHAPAPQLPPAQRAIPQAPVKQTRSRKITFNMSACTANVQSLSSGLQGHAGKLAYLRQQVRALHFNFLGIQEAKTEEICTYVDQVYRLAGGCEQHQQGVELWINMAQPYAHVNGKPCHFEKGDFQIAHKDPRILVVRIDTVHWNGWIVVAYAPQSGISRSTRAEWWQHFAQVT